MEKQCHRAIDRRKRKKKEGSRGLLTGRPRAISLLPHPSALPMLQRVRTSVNQSAGAAEGAIHRITEG